MTRFSLLPALRAAVRPIRRRLFLKFILATLGIGVLANALVLSFYYQYRRTQIIGGAAAEMATIGSRVARPIAEYLSAGERDPARDLLTVFAAFPYVICADVFTAGDAPAISWPAIGCSRIRHAGNEVRVTVPAAGGAVDLAIRYDPERVLAGLRNEFLVLGTLAVAGGLAIILPAIVTFFWTINRPLGRLLGAIEAFERREVAQRVGYRSEDEIGQVIRSYNTMLDREVQRVGEIRDAHRAIVESVSYASRIQRGLLPRPDRLRERFADAAVLWEPRDVVSGDIYWMSAAGPRTTVALLDCTGHGVPGGFLTMLAVSLLERIVGEHEDPSPAEILRRLNRLMRRLLNQDVAHPTSNDGMDAAICRIDPAARTAVFAGARLSLLVATADNRVVRVRGDRVSIGYPGSPADARFRETAVPLDPTTRLFLATDGVTDQVGGTRRLAFGYGRLIRTITRHLDRPLDQVLHAVKAELDAYAAGERRRDDLTVVALAPRLA